MEVTAEVLARVQDVTYDAARRQGSMWMPERALLCSLSDEMTCSVCEVNFKTKQHGAIVTFPQKELAGDTTAWAHRDFVVLMQATKVSTTFTLWDLSRMAPRTICAQKIVHLL